MKITKIVAFFVAALLAVAAPVVQASNDPSTSGGPGHPNEPGDDPGGNVHTHHVLRGFLLTPTAEAPTGSGGWVVIGEDPTAPSLNVATLGLAAGSYTVNVTSKADGSVTAFGSLEVGLPIDPLPLHHGIAVGEPNPNDANDDWTEHLFGIASLAFPDGYDPANVASVQIDTAEGVTLLAGENQLPDITPGGRDHHHEQFVLKGTADAPEGAGGRAEIEAENDDDPAVDATVGGVVSASLKIETHGLAAGAYTVSVTKLSDGSAVTLGTIDVAEATDVNETTRSKDALPFPDGTAPSDVASVQVTDASEVLMLDGSGCVRGGHVEGNEHLSERVALAATADAPEGAGGVAEIEAHNREGANTASLEVHTVGLDAGTYTVSVTSLADGSATVLGTFDIADVLLPSISSVTDDGNVSFDSEQETGLPFPTGFNPLDVATVQVADANGVVMLTGDFSNVVASATTSFSARVRITPGPAAPDAKGTATASTRVRKHKIRQAFTLAAKGAPASSELTVQVNGSDAGKVKTTRKGRVVLRKLPAGAHVHKVTSVTLQDANGTTVLSAHF